MEACELQLPLQRDEIKDISSLILKAGGVRPGVSGASPLSSDHGTPLLLRRTTTAIIPSQLDRNLAQNFTAIANTSKSIEVIKENATFEILKLPDWLGLRDAEVSVYVPKSNSETIQIILNKTSQQWNELVATSGDGAESAVVSVNRKSLRNRQILEEEMKDPEDVKAIIYNRSGDPDDSCDYT